MDELDLPITDLEESAEEEDRNRNTVNDVGSEEEDVATVEIVDDFVEHMHHEDEWSEDRFDDGALLMDGVLGYGSNLPSQPNVVAQDQVPSSALPGKRFVESAKISPDNSDEESYYDEIIDESLPDVDDDCRASHDLQSPANVDHNDSHDYSSTEEISVNTDDEEYHGNYAVLRIEAQTEVYDDLTDDEYFQEDLFDVAGSSAPADYDMEATQMETHDITDMHLVRDDSKEDQFLGENTDLLQGQIEMSDERSVEDVQRTCSIDDDEGKSQQNNVVQNLNDAGKKDGKSDSILRTAMSSEKIGENIINECMQVIVLDDSFDYSVKHHTEKFQNADGDSNQRQADDRSDYQACGEDMRLLGKLNQHKIQQSSHAPHIIDVEDWPADQPSKVDDSHQGSTGSLGQTTALVDLVDFGTGFGETEDERDLHNQTETPDCSQYFLITEDNSQLSCGGSSTAHISLEDAFNRIVQDNGAQVIFHVEKTAAETFSWEAKDGHVIQEDLMSESDGSSESEPEVFLNETYPIDEVDNNWTYSGFNVYGEDDMVYEANHSFGGFIQLEDDVICGQVQRSYQNPLDDMFAIGNTVQENTATYEDRSQLSNHVEKMQVDGDTMHHVVYDDKEFENGSSQETTARLANSEPRETETRLAQMIEDEEHKLPMYNTHHAGDNFAVKEAERSSSPMSDDCETEILAEPSGDNEKEIFSSQSSDLAEMQVKQEVFPKAQEPIKRIGFGRVCEEPVKRVGFGRSVSVDACDFSPAHASLAMQNGMSSDDTVPRFPLPMKRMGFGRSYSADAFDSSTRKATKKGADSNLGRRLNPILSDDDTTEKDELSASQENPAINHEETREDKHHSNHRRKISGASRHLVSPFYVGDVRSSADTCASLFSDLENEQNAEVHLKEKNVDSRYEAFSHNLDQIQGRDIAILDEQVVILDRDRANMLQAGLEPPRWTAESGADGDTLPKEDISNVPSSLDGEIFDEKQVRIQSLIKQSPSYKSDEVSVYTDPEKDEPATAPKKPNTSDRLGTSLVVPLGIDGSDERSQVEYSVIAESLGMGGVEDIFESRSSKTEEKSRKSVTWNEIAQVKSDDPFLAGPLKLHDETSIYRRTKSDEKYGKKRVFKLFYDAPLWIQALIYLSISLFCVAAGVILAAVLGAGSTTTTTQPQPWLPITYRPSPSPATKAPTFYIESPSPVDETETSTPTASPSRPPSLAPSRVNVEDFRTDNPVTARPTRSPSTAPRLESTASPILRPDPPPAPAPSQGTTNRPPFLWGT